VGSTIGGTPRVLIWLWAATVIWCALVAFQAKTFFFGGPQMRLTDGNTEFVRMMFWDWYPVALLTLAQFALLAAWLWTSRRVTVSIVGMGLAVVFLAYIAVTVSGTSLFWGIETRSLPWGAGHVKYPSKPWHHDPFMVALRGDRAFGAALVAGAMSLGVWTAFLVNLLLQRQQQRGFLPLLNKAGQHSDM
jgi:hypothetical protein